MTITKVNDLTLPCVHSLQQLQGSVVIAILGIGWFISAINRRRTLLSLLNKPLVSFPPLPPHAPTHSPHAPTPSSSATTLPTHPPTSNVPPKVSVVMPVKGMREHSRNNWASHLSSSDGLNRPSRGLEFVFVVESEADPAYDTLLALIEQSGQTGEIVDDIDQGRVAKARVCLSGPSTNCGQKVHK